MQIYNYISSHKQKQKIKKSKFFRFRKFFTVRKIATWLLRLTAVGILFFAILFLYYTHDMPNPNQLLERQVPESTKIFDRDGNLLYEIHGEYKRTLVNLDQIPLNLQHATVAIEDKDFYKHRGISITGILRAVIKDVITGSKSQGGSTITQQFVKNAILSKDKSFDRKIREIILSIALEAKFSKDEILKMYLNEIPYGKNAYGAEAAAETYFGKNAKDLSLAESAYLASMPQRPSFFSPTGPNREALDARKNFVLSNMRAQGYITQEQELTAKAEAAKFNSTTTGIKAPHFVLWVQEYLEQKYGEKTLSEGGLKVYTTLNSRLQEIAEKAVKDGAEKNSSKYNAHNAALVAIDPKTGQILAMVGSKDYFGKAEPEGCAPGSMGKNSCLFEPNFNVATLAVRQPGSSFKPYVYVTAFGKDFKFAPASMLIDVVTDFGKYGDSNYIPKNYNGNSYGPVSMRQALAGSLNVPAVKTLALVGVRSAIKTARDLGITTPLSESNCGLSLVLGGCGVRLVDHVAAYATLANEGNKHEKTAILKILDKDGKILEEYKNNTQQILDPQAVYELISVMTDNKARSYIFGANSPLILPDRIVAAKTGTTQDWHDGWTLGFTPSLAAGVWVGNNNNKEFKNNADGVIVAAPIWHEFMQEALKNSPAETFKVPDGIKQVTVDAVSGKLPTSETPTTKVETFADFSVPTESDDVHILVAIDSLTGQPATQLTPPSQTNYQSYTVFHSENPKNPAWENPVVAWATASGYTYPNNDANINNPENLQFNNSGSNGSAPNLEILKPLQNTIIAQTPINIEVFADSPNGISRVDLMVDGQFNQSLTTKPYNFSLNKTLQDGQHIFAVKAVDNNGGVAQSSVNITYSLNSSLIMTDPDSNSSVNFPLNLTAQSPNNYDYVKFYLLPQSGPAKLIGKSDNLSKPADMYIYSLTWQDALPAAGTYYIYAQSSGGNMSPKIKIVVP